MTREEMDAAIAAIDSYVERFPQELVTALWEARAWIEYGYESWHAMCAARGWTQRNVLTAPERRPVVEALRQEGMSIPAISAATGASVGTIHSDLSALKSAGKELPDEVTSLDGRTRPATRPEVITAEEFTERYESENPMPDVDSLIPADLRFRRRFWQHMKATYDLLLDLDYPQYFEPDMADSLSRFVDDISRKHTEFAQSRRTLRAIQGGNP